MMSLRSLAVVLGAIVLSSCGDKNAAQNIAAPTAGAAVLFANYGVNAPSVNFYANNLKLTATSSTACSSAVDGKTADATCLGAGKEATSGTPYGSAGNGNGAGLYASVEPGAYTLSGRIATTPDNGLAISNTAATLENGKFYSYYLSGIYNSTAKTVEGFTVEDAIPAVDYASASVRFVNAISNSQPMTLYAKEQLSGLERAVGSTVAYKGAGAFVALPSGVYDLSTRVAGSSTNVIAATGVAFLVNHAYTVGARGDITATTGTNQPALTSLANR